MMSTAVCAAAPARTSLAITKNKHHTHNNPTHLFVQPHDGRDAARVKVGRVVLGHHRDEPHVRVAPRGGAAEREQLARHDPGEVAVLHGLVVLVLAEVEAPARAAVDRRRVEEAGAGGAREALLLVLLFFGVCG